MSNLERKGAAAPTVTVSLDPDLSGNFICSGASDNVEIQAAIDYVDSLGGGSVFVKRGTYDIDAAIELSGAGTESLNLTGAGTKATTFEMGAGDNCIELTAGARVALRDFEILMSGETGHGIFGVTVDASSCIYGHFENLLIRQNLATFWGIYIKNPSYCTFDHMQINTFGGGGFRLENDFSGANRGNCTINNLNVELPDDVNDTIGVLLDSTDGIMNLNTFTHVNVLGLGAFDDATGRIGIKLDDTWRNTFLDVGLETKNTGIEIDGTSGTRSAFNRFYGGYITCSDDAIHINADTARGNVFKDFECAELGAATAFLIREENSAAPLEGNIYENVRGTGVWQANYILVNEEAELFGKTGMANAEFQFAENWGIAEASDGDIVTHGMIDVDADDLLVFVNVLETDAHYAANAEAIGVNNFTLSLYDITAGAPETVDKTIQWYAKYKATDTL